MIDERRSKVLEGVAAYCAYYRANPHRFAKDYLHLNLHLFQKILLNEMSRSSTVVFVGCRGIGKSFLSAVYCVIQAILYPGQKICIASGTRGQSLNVLEKIMLELVPRSPELALEIDYKLTKVNGTNAIVAFKNGSYIKVVTAGDSARGNRATLLLIDEYRLVSKETIDTVLRKFLTQKRMPPYQSLKKDERKKAYEKEQNKIMYLSSAYFKDHWSYTKCLDTFRMMLDENKHQFVCGLPYQLALAEGLIDRDIVIDEMMEADFNQIRFEMEYEALWYGGTDGAFFDFNVISKNRTIKYPMLPDSLSSKVSDSKKLRIPTKQAGEIRILSADIALMSSKKRNNDATAIFINQMIPSKSGRYTCNFVFPDANEGYKTDQEALTIRRYFDEYNCDYLVLDTAGIGLGCFDALTNDIVDPETGVLYPAISSCNNSEMASRCSVAGAEKVIWAIKASAQFNSDAAFLTREGFRSGRIRLLTTEYDADELLSEIKGYSSLSPAEQMKFKAPYIHTTLLVDELTKLLHEENGGKVKLFERAGMRKDRYSSLSYNYYVAMQIEAKASKNKRNNISSAEQFVIRPPSSNRKEMRGYGQKGKGSWKG